VNLKSWLLGLLFSVALSKKNFLREVELDFPVLLQELLRFTEIIVGESKSGSGRDKAIKQQSLRIADLFHLFIAHMKRITYTYA
jgi:hypothetical protein